MTAPSRATFGDRLDLARRLITRGPTDVPVAFADQITAAGRETRHLHDQLGAALPLIEPGRCWYQRADLSPSDETRAYLLAALLGCHDHCIHIRRGGPRPAIVQLPLRRVDCERCIGTLRRPPADEDDRCDVCTTRGVATFHPFAVRMGPLLLAGDACPSCAAVLGILQPAVAAS